MSDEKIVELFWERNENAIRETERSYGRYLHYISYGILKDDEDAKETVNDVYLKAWNVIPPQRPNPLKTFLGRMARQLSINRLEKRSAKKRAEDQYTLALDELSECIPDGNTKEDMSDLIALQDVLNDFLKTLPNTERKIFIRRYWYMHSISQLASDFSMSESKVKSMLMRTRKKLKMHLEKEGFEI